jgi:hypothetical protein
MNRHSAFPDNADASPERAGAARTAPQLAMDDEDVRALAKAKATLQRPSLAIRLASMVGTRIDTLLRHIPGGAHDKITDIAEAALRKCLDVALKTLPAESTPAAGARMSTGVSARRPPSEAGSAGFPPDADPVSRPGGLFRTAPSATVPPSKSPVRALARLTDRVAQGARAQSRTLHKLAVIGTGAAGGAFGMIALPAELPVTTTLMFRSICSIAQDKGERLADPAVQMQCLLVLALGGPASDDDDAQWGYFMVRSALAQAVSRASSELAAKGLGAHSSSVLLQLIRQIASRLSVQISEQIAAKSVPALGAVFGAAINAAFIDHFQKIADAHFTVRSLERRYGEQAVRAQWDVLPD